jgi:hypothetical protein
LEVNLLVVTETNPSTPGAGMLEGSVNCFSDPTETNLLESAEIQGGLSLNNTNTLPGLYNIVISPPSADPAQGPGGYSFGGATVNKNGAVALVLNLADGASPVVSFSGFLAKNGVCPFYASLYGGNGVILGWMQFATNGSGNMQPQPIQWVKQAVADTSYTHGFIGASSISGGLYLPPKAGANVFGVGETALTFAVDRGYSGLSLPDEEDFAVTFNPAKNIFADPSKVTIALTPSSGALTGAFPAGGKTPFTYHGVEVDGAGYGFYISTNKETGPIWIGVQN